MVNKKKIIFDSILNIFATGITALMLQIIILPIVASEIGIENYGFMITLVSFFNLFSHPFGSVLNNIRLLQNKQYEENYLNGDFNLLCLFSIIINSLIISFGLYFYYDISNFSTITFLVVIGALNIMMEYSMVFFRLNLNYNKVLVNNILMVFGYAFGMVLFIITSRWELIYLFGYLFSTIYIIMNSDFFNEKLTITPYFFSTLKKCLILFVSAFMKTAITYADKLILFPLLGSGVVSIYYAATMLGKIISMVIGPISGVLLSYLTKINRLKMKNFIFLLLFSSVVGIIGYFFCILISQPLIELLYPQFANKALDLVLITTATAVVDAQSMIIQPVILRYNAINWQVWISIINVISYITCALIFYNLYGLIGFCLGLLIASVIKVLLLISIFVSSDKKFNDLGKRVNNDE